VEAAPEVPTRPSTTERRRKSTSVGDRYVRRSEHGTVVYPPGHDGEEWIFRPARGEAE
jgi:hypothetical protein